MYSPKVEWGAFRPPLEDTRRMEQGLEHPTLPYDTAVGWHPPCSVKHELKGFRRLTYRSRVDFLVQEDVSVGYPSWPAGTRGPQKPLHLV